MLEGDYLKKIFQFGMIALFNECFFVGRCQSSLAATRLGSSFVFDSSSFICAGGEAGKDACTGDGGSPLVCNMSGRFYVVGLSAWGIGCAQVNVPGVYVNVATYVPFIQTSMSSS